MTPITSQKFRKIIGALKPYKPLKVILFGSWAWSKPTGDSDIDLLIIKHTKKKLLKRMIEAHRYLFDINLPFDILVMTPKEVEKRINSGDFFVDDILKKGKVLYEAK